MVNPNPPEIPAVIPSVSVAFALIPMEPTLNDRVILLSHKTKETEGDHTEAIAETPPPVESNPADRERLPILSKARFTLSKFHAPEASMKSNEPADI